MILSTIPKLNEEDRLAFFSELDKNIKSKATAKDIYFDLFSIFADNRRISLSGKKSLPLYAGLDFLRVKSMIRKKLNFSNVNNKDSSPLGDITKMTMKERIRHKENQIEINSRHNLYEDIKDYIQTEINNENKILNLRKNIKQSYDPSSSPDIKAQVDQIFSQVVIEDMNEIMINNILDNKRLYVAVVLVRNERLNSLYEKLLEYNKNL